jgi:hypothetical protein
MKTLMKMDSVDPKQSARPTYMHYRTAGIVMICAGLVFAVDQFLRTGWLSLLVLPVLGSLGLLSGIRDNRLLWAIPGALVAGLGLGGVFILIQIFDFSVYFRLGSFFLSMAFGFFGVLLVTILTRRKKAYWAIIPGLSLVGIGIPFLLNRVSVFDFILYGITGIGLSLLIWGVLEKLIGLIIPGSLLLGIGPGIYSAWAKLEIINGLTDTGVMLVWFAFGWGLITLVMRVVTERFVWWPLIPGGLLAVVGWGLYIGGDPGNALSFIGNTGSIGLIIFGVYLLLLRRGFKD